MICTYMLTLQVTSCLDDTNQSTRLVSCKVLQLLLTEKQHWTGTCVAHTYMYTHKHCTYMYVLEFVIPSGRATPTLF